MKRLSVLAMVMIVMASCAKENIQPKNEPTGEKALLEIGLASTKTALGTEYEENGKKFFPIVWSEGDEIAVIENMGVAEKQNVLVYKLLKGAGTENGTFEKVSGGAVPKEIKDVIYPASAAMPNSTLISNIPIKDVASLIPAKDATQEYAENSFDPKSPIMYFHRETTSEQIVLKPASSIVCIPIIGVDDNDYVTSVVWQHMDGDKRTVTLKCPEKGVKLSATDPVNFYLSIRPMEKSYATCNAIVYVHLKNGAVQVRSFRTKGNYAAGTLHRFTPWKLGKKAKWSIKYVGSERETATFDGIPLGQASYMIDGNALSWWEFRRNSKGSMAGPHKVIIDLGKTEHIKGLKIKGPETEKTPKYTVKDDFGEKEITVSDGYNAPAVVFASFLKEGELTDVYIKDFGTTASFENKAEEKFYAVKKSTTDNKYNIIEKSMTDCYGSKMEKYWELPLSKERDARYLVIHFYQCWNDPAKAGAASKMKVAELDIY